MLEQLMVPSLKPLQIGHNITNSGSTDIGGLLHPRVNDVFAAANSRVTASSIYSSTSDPKPWRAFNGVWPTFETDVGWGSTMEDAQPWLMYQHTEPMRATGVAMATFASGTVTGAVNSFAIEISNNGIDFTRIWTTPEEKPSNIVPNAYFDIFDETALYWRCVVLRRSSNRIAVVRELQYFARP